MVEDSSKILASEEKPPLPPTYQLRGFSVRRKVKDGACTVMAYWQTVNCDTSSGVVKTERKKRGENLIAYVDRISVINSLRILAASGITSGVPLILYLTLFSCSLWTVSGLNSPIQLRVPTGS